jgi:hypothetical protein
MVLSKSVLVSWLTNFAPTMSPQVDIRLRPEEEELRVKQLELDSLERDLVEKELQLAGLHGELAAFERLYLKTVGVLYAELDEIEARITELKARSRPSECESTGNRPTSSAKGHRVPLVGR